MKKEKKSKTVFLTGGSGFIGKSIVPRLIEEGYHIKALARPAGVANHLKRPEVTLVIGGMRSCEWMTEALKDVDFVVHAAATMAGNWDDFFQINVKATELLLEESVKRKIKRFVYISSVSVYQHSTMNESPVFTEDSPYENEESTTFYSRSKMEAEKLVWQFNKEQDLPCVVLRPGAVYGPAGNIFPASMGLQIGDTRILLMGDSSSKLPLVYVENVVDAIAKSLEKEELLNGCFNLVEDKSLSRKDYMKVIKEKVSPKASGIPVPMWFMRFMKFSLKSVFGLMGKKAPLADLNLKMYSTTIKYSNEKWNNIAGPEPYVSFEESIERTMAWFKSQRIVKRSTGLVKGKVEISSNRKLNVGIIGCGGISHAHISILQKIENVGNIFIADPNQEALETVGEKFTVVEKYLDYKQMLEKEQLDVVHILAPPQFHAEIAVHAAESGCNVLLEKPMALNTAEAEKIAKAAKENKIKMCMVHNHLFDKVMIEAREILNSGTLGKLTFVESWYGTQYGTLSPAFDPDKYWGYSLPGSLYQDYMPHAMYVLTEIMECAEVSDVYSKLTAGVPFMKTDELKVMLENEHSMGMVSVSLTSSPRFQFVNVYGTGGSMKIDFLNKIILVDKEIGPVPNMINRNILAFKKANKFGIASIKNAFSILNPQKSIFEGTDRLIRLFYRSILLDEPAPVTVDEGLHLMRLMDQIWGKMDSEKIEKTEQLV
jgi:2-alkyl-3-oxoalkanoate reductase